MGVLVSCYSIRTVGWRAVICQCEPSYQQLDPCHLASHLPLSPTLPVQCQLVVTSWGARQARECYLIGHQYFTHYQVQFSLFPSPQLEEDVL